MGRVILTLILALMPSGSWFPQFLADGELFFKSLELHSNRFAFSEFVSCDKVATTVFADTVIEFKNEICLRFLDDQERIDRSQKSNGAGNRDRPLPTRFFGPLASPSNLNAATASVVKPLEDGPVSVRDAELDGMRTFTVPIMVHQRGDDMAFAIEEPRSVSTFLVSENNLRFAAFPDRDASTPDVSDDAMAVQRVLFRQFMCRDTITVVAHDVSPLACGEFSTWSDRDTASFQSTPNGVTANSISFSKRGCARTIHVFFVDRAPLFLRQPLGLDGRSRASKCVGNAVAISPETICDVRNGPAFFVQVCESFDFSLCVTLGAVWYDLFSHAVLLRKDGLGQRPVSARTVIGFVYCTMVGLS